VATSLPDDPTTTGNAPNPTAFMPANPEVGDVFKPKDPLPLVAETAEVERVNVTVKVPTGRFTDTIKIKETSTLELGSTIKWYAPRVGVVMERAKREELNLISSTLVVALQPRLSKCPIGALMISNLRL
jgi:hypothetical protein